MLLVYDSLTGNVERFIKKVVKKESFDCIQLNEEVIVEQPFILITYTIGFGEIPKSSHIFLEKNYKKLLGVASSGNRNWGDNFAKSAELISKKYNVPILLKFELSGTNNDVETFVQEVKKFEN